MHTKCTQINEGGTIFYLKTSACVCVCENIFKCVYQQYLYKRQTPRNVYVYKGKLLHSCNNIFFPFFISWCDNGSDKAMTTTTCFWCINFFFLSFFSVWYDDYLTEEMNFVLLVKYDKHNTWRRHTSKNTLMLFLMQNCVFCVYICHITKKK